MSPTVARIVTSIVAYIVARALNPLSKAAEDGAGAEVGRGRILARDGKESGSILVNHNLLKFFVGLV